MSSDGVSREIKLLGESLVTLSEESYERGILPAKILQFKGGKRSQAYLNLFLSLRNRRSDEKTVCPECPPKDSGRGAVD